VPIVGPEDKALAFFRRVYLYLEARIKIFVSLPISKLEPLVLQRRLADMAPRRSSCPQPQSSRHRETSTFPPRRRCS
jgi:hypothetical protein